MKQVIINVGEDNYDVVSFGDDSKPLSDEQKVGIMLAVAMDKMIESGYSIELIAKIIDEAYESRL